MFIESQRKEWLGYAFIVYRDAAEAKLAIELLNGKEIAKGFVARLQPATRRDRAVVASGLELNCDPPIMKQISPLSLATLRERLPSIGGDPFAIWPLRNALEKQYTETPRPEIHIAGREMPKSIWEPLLHELTITRWPANVHRKRVKSQRYLILSGNCSTMDNIVSSLSDVSLSNHAGVCTTGDVVCSDELETHSGDGKQDADIVTVVKGCDTTKDHDICVNEAPTRDGETGENQVASDSEVLEQNSKPSLSSDKSFSRLRRLAHIALRWASPDFVYTSIAVTKNFCGSPHIDSQDVTPQYAVRHEGAFNNRAFSSFVLTGLAMFAYRYRLEILKGVNCVLNMKTAMRSMW